METANASLTRKVSLLEDDLDRTEGEQTGPLDQSLRLEDALLRRRVVAPAFTVPASSSLLGCQSSGQPKRPISHMSPTAPPCAFVDIRRTPTAHGTGTTLPQLLLYLQDRANTLANKLESTEREAEQIGRAHASLSREEGGAQERAETLEAQLKTVQVGPKTSTCHRRRFFCRGLPTNAPSCPCRLSSCGTLAGKAGRHTKKA